MIQGFRFLWDLNNIDEDIGASEWMNSRLGFWDKSSTTSVTSSELDESFAKVFRKMMQQSSWWGMEMERRIG